MTVDDELHSAPLYKRLLGPKYDALPEAIQVMHNLQGSMQAEGTSRVERGGSIPSRLIAALFGLPRSGDKVSVRTTFVRDGAREVCQRAFAGTVFRTTQELGSGKYAGYLIERFGSWSFILAVPSGPGGLRLEPRGLRIFGLPLPSFLWPRVRAGESVVNGHFAFDVTLDLPLIGRLIRYRGTLRPVREGEAAP